jgi:H+/Cl- antiporter ClcA
VTLSQSVLRRVGARAGAALGAAFVVGLIAGVGSAAFLHSLNWATRLRMSHGWLLYLLPVAGLAMGALYHYCAGRSARGMSLVFDEIHAPSAHLPARMAPLIFVTAVATHVFGGSAGREGVAVLVTAGIADQIPRMMRVSPAARRSMVPVAIAAAFGAVFGTPVAGAVFALEVPRGSQLRTGASFVPCLAASFIGDRVTRSLGIHHMVNPAFPALSLQLGLLGRVALFGAACGLVALAYVTLVEGFKHVAARRVGWPPLRPFIGGLTIIVLVALAGTRAYLGLSVPLGDVALGGVAVGASVFAWKLVFTAVTLGSGFQGGEVTPLFVMGATFGGAFGHLVGLPAPVAAAIGFSTVFAAATNTPIACAVLAVELFGGNVLPYAALAGAVSTVISTHRSIYPNQAQAD